MMQKVHEEPTATGGPEPQCWNCKFFIYLGTPPYSNGIGLCRRHAPTTKQTGPNAWPLALNIDWCGEYQLLPVGKLAEARRPIVKPEPVPEPVPVPDAAPPIEAAVAFDPVRDVDELKY
jgi:hypothetical protein